MTLLSCRYFMTLCEMGTINAASRKLYISQQSLSEHMKKLEDELGCQLFYRENPIVLTPAGECMRQASEKILQAISQLHLDIEQCTGEKANVVTIGFADYGMPEFFPAILNEFMTKNPDCTVRSVEFDMDEPIPEEADVIISAREMGPHYKSEQIITDYMVVCVSDMLLQKTYGDAWRQKKEALAQGDIGAVSECPFVRNIGTPLERLESRLFEQVPFRPRFLHVSATPESLTKLCENGDAVGVSFADHARKTFVNASVYRIGIMPDPIPSGFVCYRDKVRLSPQARQLIAISRKVRRGRR